MSEVARPVAMVTGSGRHRVGNVVANSLAALGYRIAIHYRQSSDEAQQTAQALRASGTQCEVFQADVGIEQDVDRMFEQVAAHFGRIDVLVTAASTWDTQSLESVTAADIQQSFAANSLGTFLCARRAGLMMTQQAEGGAIITIGDWAIQRPYLNHAAYFLAKGSIPTLTRVLAVELGQRNPRVRVNCIHPGPVMFPPESSPAEQAAMIDSTLVKNANCPEVIAQAVQFLVENKFVTGICLPVDGGRSIFAGETRRMP